MPRKGDRWTHQERVFVSNLAMTDDKVYAATKAGYKHPHIKGHQLAAKPVLAAEAARIQTEKLFNELLPLAVKVHAEILADPKAPAGARVQAVKLAYDRTLGAQDGAQAKEPHEMTAEEIAEAIGKLEAIAAGRAKPVESAQIVRNDHDIFE